MPDPDPTLDFGAVLADELEVIQSRRNPARTAGPADRTEQAARRQALRMDLVGLALSGGGIRSATFALGVLQGLASLRLLTRIDYLSTVSGGGYIGSWLAAWIRRDGDVSNVERQLSPSRVDNAAAVRPLPADTRVDEEPAAVCHLRHYASYLTPWRGLFTADTWTLLAIYVRNLLINFTILIPATVFVVLLARWLVLLYTFGGFSLRAATPGGSSWLDFSRWLLGVLLAVLVGVICLPDSRVTSQRASRASSRIALATLAGVLACLSAVLLGPPAPIDLAVWGVLLVAAVFVAWAKTRSRPITRAAYLKTWLVYRIALPLCLAGLLAWWSFTRGVSSWESYGAGLVSVLLLAAFAVAGWILTGGPRLAGGQPLSLREYTLGMLLPMGLMAILGGWALGADPRPTIAAAARAAAQGVAFPATVPADRGAANLAWLAEADAPQPLRYAGYDAVTTLLDRLGVRHTIPWLPYVVGFLLAAVVIAGARAIYGYGWTWRTGRVLVASVVAAVAGAFGLYLTLVHVVWPWFLYPYVLATFAPPLLVGVLVTIGYVQIAVAGRAFDEEEREWRSRMGSWLLRSAAVWLAFFAATLYLPAALVRLHAALSVSAVLAWLVTVASGMSVASSPRVAQAGRLVPLLARLLVPAVPALFLIGLVALTSTAVGLAVSEHGPTHHTDPFWAEVCRQAHVSGETLTWWTLGSFVVLVVLSQVLDVNLFSLHALYANRLTRCYLGATRHRPGWSDVSPAAAAPAAAVLCQTGAPIRSRPVAPPRLPDPVTNFDKADDLPLADLGQAKNGPYLLINTALNMVAGRQLALQDRKAASFLLSHAYCGSVETGYAPTPSDGDARFNLTLGRALAISGAAVDPNMSLYQSPALTACLTMLNARLGYWIENPARPAGAAWQAEGPPFAAFLLDELLGRTHDNSDYVHLSDGGHFENSGVYELIRRRCRYVILVDAGDDPDDASYNLAHLIRMCRIDFGVRIEIDTAALRKGPDGLSRWHCAVGRIRYDEVDAGAVAGTLVFLRASLTGDEPADIRHYANAHPAFPHQSTLNQFFDEAQFESYRVLGFHHAWEVFCDAADWLAAQEMAADAEEYQDQTRRFFARVRNRWFPPPPDFTQRFDEASRRFTQLLQRLRTEPALAALGRQLYPEAEHLVLEGSAAAQERPTRELLAVSEMLSVMELAWMGVHLDGYFSHPLNRGWMDVMFRWTASETFQRHWPVLRAEFSKDFVTFCEKALCVPRVPPKVVQYHPSWSHAFHLAVRQLSREFGLEFSLRTLGLLDASAAQLPREEVLADWVRRVTHTSQPRPHHAGQPLAWLIALGQAGHDVLQASWSASDYPCGLALVRPRPSGAAGHEFLLWLRGAHRTLGLGSEALRELVPILRAALAPSPASPLVTRYPHLGAGSGERLQRALWASFFHDFNFRQEQALRPTDRLIELAYDP